MALPELVKIREGQVEVFVPKSTVEGKGPGKKMPGFYNPAMSLCRDINVLLLRTIGRAADVLDALSATGVRGIRIKAEALPNALLVLCDKDPRACKIIEKNLRLNKITGIVHCRSANALMAEQRFDYIDIDPYGTPAPYMDAAIQSIRKGGILGITATDVAVLCGRYPRTAKRRYMCGVRRLPFYKEFAIRILLGFVARIAAMHDRAIFPVLSHATEHYIRVYVQVDWGAGKADKCLENLRYLKASNDGLEFEICDDANMLGPIWASSIHDPSVIKSLRVYSTLHNPGSVEKLVERIREECKAPPFYRNINDVARVAKVSPPRVERIIKALRSMGYTATKTQFCGECVKTDADLRTMVRILKGGVL